MAFEDAETFCQTQGGHLVSYKNLKEQQEVEQCFVGKASLMPNYHTFYWMGLKTGDVFSVWPNFTWVDHSDAVYAGNYQHWGTARCAAMAWLWQHSCRWIVADPGAWPSTCPLISALGWPSGTAAGWLAAASPSSPTTWWTRRRTAPAATSRRPTTALRAGATPAASNSSPSSARWSVSGWATTSMPAAGAADIPACQQCPTWLRLTAGAPRPPCSHGQEAVIRLRAQWRQIHTVHRHGQLHHGSQDLQRHGRAPRGVWRAAGAGRGRGLLHQ